MAIDLLICATRRAAVLDRTLRSFKENLFDGHDVNVHINIDPIGPDETSGAVIDTVWKYFDRIQHYEPKQACFGAAFKRLWLSASSEFVFWLEDDWELSSRIDLGRMLEIMMTNPDLAMLRLPWKPAGEYSMKAWHHQLAWNGEFFECPVSARREVGFCGHPSLVNGSFMRECAPWIDPRKNPEKQFHHGHATLNRIVSKWSYGVYSRPLQGAVVHDIGRRWMVKNGYVKKGVKAFFTQWEKITNG